MYTPREKLEQYCSQVEMMEFVTAMLKVQKLPLKQRLAIRYYLKGMLDARLLCEDNFEV